MVKKSTLLLLAFMGILVFVTVARHAKATKSNPRPIRRDELMALVSGHSLPENIAYELNHHGVCSAPTDHFKTLLSNAGAASKALTALNEAKIINCTPADLPDDDPEPVPLARLDPASPPVSDLQRPARPARIVLYRRPLMARADDEEDLSELVLDVVVEEFARLLGVDPQAVDPGYPDED